MMMNPSFYRTIHQEGRSITNGKDNSILSLVKQRRRLIRTIIILFAALLVFTCFLILTTNAASEAVEQASVDEPVVLVAAGDTLWDIAAEYQEPDEDIRKLVFLIKKRNQLETADISPGQTLIIPSH